MPIKKQSHAATNKKVAPKPRIFDITDRGITNTQQFAQAMSALMHDLVCGAISQGQGNTICNAGGKMLKNAELELKHGKQMPNGRKLLQLSTPLT